jgi:PAS domain S-box-containing protein
MFYETHVHLLLRVQRAVDEIALDIICKDGRILPTLINARQKRNAAGEPVVNRYTIFNSSERRMYERELLAARDLFETTLSSIGDGVIATDAEARVTFMNPVAEALSGWTGEAAQGKPIEEVVELVREDDGSAVENPIRHSLRAGKIVGLSHDTVLIARDGRRVPMDDSASPIRDAKGDIAGCVLVFRDISERRRKDELERERQIQFRETLRLESLGRMAGGIAHDFNNLLTAILGNASLLAETVADAEKVLVNEIVHAGDSAAGLTKQMLAYSGSGWLSMTSLDLKEFLQNHLASLSAALPRRLPIELEPGPGDHRVEADAAEMRQVLMNILINAAEATAEGEGKVTIRTAVLEKRPARFSPYLQARVAEGTYAMVEIRDNGTGMTADTLTKIFDPFYTTKFTGRGLGLSAVLGVVRGHGGDIEVLSEPGAGSTFRIFLPAAQRGERRLPRTAAAVQATGEKQTILVVDDEETIRKVASAALKSRGMHVLVAQNGSEALEVLGAQPTIAAVILDLKMPVMTGEEALPLIQAMRPDLPVIISSGFSEVEITRRFESCGIASVLSKPYTTATIISKVTAALQSGS